MDKKQFQIACGGLLHDVGKVLFRAYGGENHSMSGYKFLKDEVKIDDDAVLEQVMFHHANIIKQAQLSSGSPAYITYAADNIASAADRRRSGEGKAGFAKDAALESIFNILNTEDSKNRGKASYNPEVLDPGGAINYPSIEKNFLTPPFTAV